MHGACLNDQLSIFKNHGTSHSHGPTKLQGSDLTNNLFLKLFIIIIIIIIIIISYNKSRQLHKLYFKRQRHTAEHIRFNLVTLNEA